MEYDLIEHRHRFSVWAAARVAQRGLRGGKVSILRDALEQSGVAEFAKGEMPIAPGTFDEAHRMWCRSIAHLAGRNVEATFGRAAKLVAIYLKSMVTLGTDSKVSQAHEVHPPIDGILLCNLCNATDLRSTNQSAWGKIKWTMLNEVEYYKLIDELRMCVSQDEPFWTLERFWTVTDDQE